MKPTIGLVAAISFLAVMPATANAQRYRNGTVTTPFGQYSMRDWMGAGGNPFQAESIREQKMTMLYQQQIMRQQQQYAQQMMKMQKARQDYLKKHPEEAARVSTQAPPASTSRATRTQPRRQAGAAASRASTGKSAGPK